ncbi:MAG: DNA mismatch repair endonuclease MutL [Bacilli bacterium]|nr:DNA mismatch repair endonuclease MutL [Bacilli bacterium]
MQKIHIMDTLLSNKIAAGEVVERCSSVVKELTENAIDAGSTIIKVDLIEAGTKSIKVTDNGSGMEKEDALLSFERHATSKIIDEDDLYRIHTLGFRGEALASIASVSKVHLRTSVGTVGTDLVIHGGKTISTQNGDARKGTIIEIQDLFYNTPARLKHMKSLYTELASITDYMNKLALSYPEIQFVLTNNESILLNTDGSGNQLKTFSQIFGLSTTKKMVEIKGENEDYIVNGYISLPEVHRASRNHMILIVNGRVVRNSDLNRTINDAYHSYKPDNRYPIVVINIGVDPSLIDVNIHPTKMDIKFSKMDVLQNLLTQIIKDVLRPKTLIPEMEEWGTEDFYEQDSVSLEQPLVQEKKTEYEEITLNLDRLGEEPILYEKKNVSSSQTETKEEESFQKPTERLPELYPIGSVHGTYIVCQNENGMYLMDQHAAKERVNYEVCLRSLTNPKEQMVPLLIPFTFELTQDESIILRENMDFLRGMHFDIAEFGVHSIVVKGHPAWISKYREEEAIKRVIDLVIHREKNFDIGRFNDHVAATMACKMSIKANDLITIEEMENLINDLRKCENPFHCPHGRPTLVHFSQTDLEKLFKRSGFDTRI